MAKDLAQILEKYINERLLLAVASNPVQGADCSRIRLRPVRIKDKQAYQATRTVGPKELHENLDAAEAVKLFLEVTGSSFRQVELKNATESAVVLVSKKGTMTIKEHRKPVTEELPATCTTGASCTVSARSTNNRTKNYVIPEGKPVDFLVELGVMTKAGKVVAAKYDKFRQINRYLEFVEDAVPSLPKRREISIIDFGCGKSYLTFALYYYLHEIKGFEVTITGLDLKEDVIENCGKLAKKLGYSGLNFLHGDIADYTGTDSVDMIVTLHACDTATDYALYKAISWNAKVIFCVPCCQHEINRQIRSEELKPVLKYGIIKERMSALLTDSLRACMLEEKGYRTQLLEFIDMEHTPKNILIRAVKKETGMLRAYEKKEESGDYAALMKSLNIEPTLYRLLNGDNENEKRQ